MVLPLSVRYAVTGHAVTGHAVTGHAVTVTNYRFKWCSVVINVIFNTCFGSVICYIGKF
jgi:hypothetical protein